MPLALRTEDARGRFSLACTLRRPMFRITSTGAQVSYSAAAYGFVHFNHPPTSMTGLLEPSMHTV